MNATKLLAKTDIHIQFNNNIFHEFELALRDGVAVYGEWDGSTPFPERFRKFAARFFKGDEDEERFVEAVTLCEEGRVGEIDLPFEKVVMMKLLTDAFYLGKFHDLADERRAAELKEEDGALPSAK